MLGVNSDGKFVPVNRDFSIRIPYGAAYDLYDAKGDALNVLTITRFEEMPVDYTDGAFQPRSSEGKSNAITFSLTHEIEEDELRKVDFKNFLNTLKKSNEERRAKFAVGSAAATDADGANYSRLKIVQNTPEIKAGYVTSDMFVAVNFTVFIFTKKHAYRGVMKLPRQPQRFKRIDLFIHSILSSVKPTI